MTTAAGSRTPTLIRTLTVRLAAVAAIAAVLQIAVVLIYYTLKDEKTGILIAVHEAETLAAAVQAVDDHTLSVHVDEAFARHYAKYPGDYAIAVVNAAGQVIHALNGPLLGTLQLDLAAQPDLWTKVEMRSGERFRVTVRRFDSRSVPFWIVFAIRHDPARLLTSILVNEMFDHVVEPMLPLFALTLLVCLAVVRRSLRPLTRAAEAAANLDPRDPKMLVPTEALPREVAELVTVINTSLARLRDMFDYQGQFLATAAHELRTPLAVLTLQLERMSGPALPALRADVDQMTRLVNQMLLVARLDTLPAPRRDKVDLAALAKAVVTRLAPLATAQQRALEVLDEGGGRCRGDGDMISDALRNLVENAIRATPARTAVCVVVGPGPRLAVDDAGPGLSEVDRSRLHQRVWRSLKRPAGGGGAGLGLFIVGKVIEAHKGTALVTTSPLGGARVEMVFPADDWQTASPARPAGSAAQPAVPKPEPAPAS